MTLTEVTPAAHPIPSVPSALAAVVRVERTGTVVVLRGEADASTRTVLSDALSRVVAAFDAGDVVIDLTEAEFMDSGAVRALAVCQQLLDRDGRMLTFRSPSRLAARVLGLFGLTELIEAEETSHPGGVNTSASVKTTPTTSMSARPAPKRELWAGSRERCSSPGLRTEFVRQTNQER